MRDAAAKIQAQFGEHALSITIEDQYYNMGEKLSL